MQFNDSDVDVMPLEIYGQPGRLEFQYPIPTPLRYPKPGRTNPYVNVFVATVSHAGASGSNPGKPLDAVRLPEPNYFRGKEKIVYATRWATDIELALTWENRDQNYAIVSICEVTLATCRDSLVMTEEKGWMELDKAPIFTKDGRQFAMALSADNYTHVSASKLPVFLKM